jgi:plasmid stabilization system protein ParE
MRRRVRWTKLAEQDALDNYLFIARDNVDAAEKLWC